MEKYNSNVELLQDKEMRLLPRKKLTDFVWTTSSQPHSVRRRKILSRHPEIEKLYGHDRSQAITAVATVILQLFLAYYISQVKISKWAFLLLVYVVSATLNHSLFTAMHEGAHGLVFPSKLGTQLFCILTTLPMGVPAAIPFRRYHLDHHIYTGVKGKDPDLPLEIEAWFFQSFFRKLLWVILFPAIYSLRPIITIPKPFRYMEGFSWIVCFTVNYSLWYYGGTKALLYCLLGTFFSMTFHPFAGHFVAEHFLFPENDAYQETNSYYGIGNFFTYNVGYHNEHHDFPRVPGSKLPLIRQIASEYYDIPKHKSWFGVLLKFLITDSVTPYNRVLRTKNQGGPIPQSAEKSKLHDGKFPYGGEKTFWPVMESSQQ